MITYASVCDGIGAAHVAWQPLGYRCVWTSEIEPFPVAVVEHHWHLPNLGDMTLIEQRQLDEHDPIDLLVGGTPCQSFSVAGLRKDWQTRVATWHSDFFSLLVQHGPGGWSGKTSPAFCRLAADGTLEPSSGRWSNSGMGSPTECWTLNTSEFHNDAAACSLSDILETGDVPQRYFLSGRACRGILRRAAKRGKKLPTQLRLALEQLAGDLSEPEKQEDKIL